jgi:anaerobic selenocysteine-containing dehydrogenase
VASALEGVLTLVYVGPMPNRTSRRAGLVLPAAFAFEQSGRALLGPGREAAFEPLLAPPAGVPTIREILALAGGGAAKADLASPVAAAAARANGQPKGEGLLLVLANDPVHFADGSLTREARWPQAVIPRPVLLLAEQDAEAAGVADGRRAVLQGPGGRAEVIVATDAAQACGQARASAAFPAVRDVFGWKLGGPNAFEPVRVRVGKA